MTEEDMQRIRAALANMEKPDKWTTLNAEQKSIELLAASSESDDMEDYHQKGDQIISDFLREQGFTALADKYDEIRKGWWYS